MRRALLALLVAVTLATSSGCGLLRAIFCCHDCGPYGSSGDYGDCGACYDDCCACGNCCSPYAGEVFSCDDGCGTYDHGCGVGLIECLFGGLFHGCHGGCGPTYWGEFSDKPDLYDPCDGCGNWIGQGCGGCGGCGDCGGCGAPYGPYGGYSDGYGGEYDGAISDYQVHEGPAVRGQPTPATPPAAEPLPTPSNKSGRYVPRAPNRRASYDAPQRPKQTKVRTDLRR